MSHFWMVRHGPTHAKTMVGWSDLPADLSDTAALARLRDYLPDAPVISSDLIRATATADAVQGARPRLTHDPDLREINFGAWEQRSFADVEAESPDLIRAYWEQPGDIRPPGGESWHDVQTRVNRVIDGLIGTAPDIIVVCHFGVILTQVQRALGISAYDAFANKIDNLSVTDLSFDNSWHIGAINHRP
ncbi:MAG: histidine phosphatase family protein [Pseudomonadota bacterium]